MANQPIQNQGIINSWSLLAFARAKGRMQVGEFKDKEGKSFKSCIFTSPTDQSKCFVSFSSNLGVLTPKEIAERQDSLQVVQLTSGNYSLCNTGENAWEDVALNI